MSRELTDAEIKKLPKAEILKMYFDLRAIHETMVYGIKNIVSPGWSWERSPECMGR